MTERSYASQSTSPFLRVFQGEAVAPPPVWLMRQAGRYLPEYRAVRAKAGGFLNLCYTPELAAEVTLQPIRRYGFDAAILFSDILVVPDALGQKVAFLEGEGPKLEPMSRPGDLARLKPEAVAATFRIVYEAVERIRAALPRETALIGFCGAPWTVATYMIGGGKSADHAETKAFAATYPDAFPRLIDLLTEVSVEYLSGQIGAGAQVVQVFDSWAGSLSGDEAAFQRWVTAPMVRLTERLRERHPAVPILGFPREAGRHLVGYVAQTRIDGVSCDTAIAPAEMAGAIAATGAVVQGNLDPQVLVAGGDGLDRAIDERLAAMRGRRFIFNLGHGIVPETPPENVARLVARVRAGTAA